MSVSFTLKIFHTEAGLLALKTNELGGSRSFHRISVRWYFSGRWIYLE